MIKAEETLTFWLFVFAYGSSVILSLIDYFFLKIVSFPESLAVVYFCIFALGFVIRLNTRRSLGKHFNLNIVIREDHTVVDEGLYKKVRHPMYFANLLIFVGFAGALSSALGILAVILFVIPVTMLRIVREERALLNKCKAYKEYCERTYRFVPSVW